jgi:NAD(P)-dependent dehydrogenase (short-subunit alcohol dehydrogenase family)
MDLDGKTALVTGGAAGIGAGFAERLAAEGMDVIVADSDQEAGAATARRIGGSFVPADVATTAGVRAAVDAACRPPGRLGVLVANARGAATPSFPAAEPERWGYTLDLNLRAVMLATQLVLDPMAGAGGGAIITVASVAGLADDTLAGRIMVCRGGEPSRLLPLVDWQTA